MRYYLLILLPMIGICLDLLQYSPGLAGTIFLIALVILGFLFALGSRSTLDWREIALSALTSLSGALATFLFANYFSLGAVLASGFVGIVGARLMKNEDRQLQLYLGAFVGMSSLARFPTLFPLILAGALGGVLWELLQESWVGVGGRLGTLAATAVLITLLFSGGGL